METMELFAADKYNLNIKELKDAFSIKYTVNKLVEYCQQNNIKGRGNRKKDNLVEIVVNFILEKLKSDNLIIEQSTQEEKAMVGTKWNQFRINHWK